jgi:glycosyl transferase family 2
MAADGDLPTGPTRAAGVELIAPAPEPDGAGASARSPSFSVLIAAYQAAAFVGDAVASALAQTHAPEEVIVCDDGSTDDLAGALEPYRDRIVVVRQENRGEGAAKNRAAQEASGDFLVWLDADDLYLPTRLAALDEAARLRPDLDILVTNAFVEANGKVLRLAYDETWAFEIEDQRTAILERCFVLGHAAVKRERFVEVGGFDPTMRTVADWDLWLRLIIGGSRAGYLPAPLARYRVRPGSLSTDRPQIVAGGLRCLERALARDDLSADERAVAERTHARLARKLEVERARQALGRRDPAARAALIRIAADGGQDPRARVKALAAALAPRVSARLLGRRAARPGAAGVWLADE